MMIERTIVARAALGGLVAGVVDIGAAALINHVRPDVILRVIARGLLGAAAMKGGAGTAALGFCLQLAMGALIGAVYGLGCCWLTWLAARWVSAGVAYGVGVFLVMEFIVVPLSAIRKVPHFTTLSLVENLAAMIIFASIITFAASGSARTARSA